MPTVPTTHAAFDVRRTACRHHTAATSATRSKKTPLTVRAAAAKITGRNEGPSNSWLAGGASGWRTYAIVPL